MKAIRIHEFGEPDVLKYEEVPDPKPEAGQVVIRVHAVGVNPVDTYIRKGIYGDRVFPFTPGMDAAGVVEAVGEGVDRVVPGDRVYTAMTQTGAYAEKTVADANHVYKLPENISFAQGAGVNVPYATAYRALLQRAHGMPGETVLVHGASGGVGTAAVQIGRMLGFTVFGTGGSDEGRKLVQEQGAHHVFDHHADDYLQQAKSATPNGAGFDIILEMLANVNLGKDLEVLAPGGRVVVIGSRGSVEINPRDTMSRDAAILGMSLFNASPKELDSIHATLYAGMESGTLKPVVGKEIPLANAAQAHIEVMESGAYGKIVLVP
ncbi:MAG: NAD(P)H-quinone oxidoreductase [Armatimonadaceae bacterium]